ncbi:MAG TPA: hypothetical protein VHE12_03600 [bacterium]|nr:hypothetical protein [bacterium]
MIRSPRLIPYSGTVFSLVIVLFYMGCKMPSWVPTPPAPSGPTPTFTPLPADTPVPLPGTPTPSAGCLTGPALTVLTGTGGPLGYCGPIGTLGTPSPTPTPAWSGSLPTHPDGKYVLASLGDWNNYLSSSYYPQTNLSPPFNPATQRLAVDAFTKSLMWNEVIDQVCDDGATIHVIVRENPGCYGNPPAWTCSSGAVLAVVLPQNGEPVEWDVLLNACPPWIQ